MAKGTVDIKTLKPGPNLAITAWIAEDGASVTGGYGGWVIVARPREVGITQWQGREPIQMQLPIVIDGYDGTRKTQRLRKSIELVCVKLERMAMPWKTTPPRVKLYGSSSNLIPHDDLDWVIGGFSWGKAIRDDDGNRVRQEVTINLISYVGVEKVKLRAAQRARK